MSPEDLRLIVAAVIGIAASIVLVVRARLHPFLALLCGAFAAGLLAGLNTTDTAAAVQKGAGDILGGTGLVVALGLSLGAMLHISQGAATLARGALSLTGTRGAPWGSLLASMVIGLPLFFETGLVLLLPIVTAAAVALDGGNARDEAKLKLILPALAGLSIMHGLVPPHPGPLLAVDALKANLGRTIGYGIVVAIPIGIVAGPLLARYLARGVTLSEPALPPNDVHVDPPRGSVALIVVLLPVVLITAGQVANVLPSLAWLGKVASPVLALLLANLVALPLLFGKRLFERALQSAIWLEAMTPAGAILLSIGAGGALKQVLVAAGLSDLLARLATAHALSPILLAWLIAVGVRLSTGSATVATITTAGVIPKVIAASTVAPEWVVLAIGAGSLFFSHVNDPGFWLVRSYIGTTTAGTFRTWSLIETVVSVLGLLLVLIGSRFF
ncbi:MAG TPA: gluconate:H+ symporter [Candidatus Acidoferrum sp.]|nr:gluconate:H+ symporter [Candidatus Acidoferrum sp.]